MLATAVPAHYNDFVMNKLPLAKRTQILAMLCEGSSMRSISRVADVSINTVTKLLEQAGEACLAIHDETGHLLLENTEVVGRHTAGGRGEEGTGGGYQRW